MWSATNWIWTFTFGWGKRKWSLWVRQGEGAGPKLRDGNWDLEAHIWVFFNHLYWQPKQFQDLRSNIVTGNCHWPSWQVTKLMLTRLMTKLPCHDYFWGFFSPQLFLPGLKSFFLTTLYLAGFVTTKGGGKNTLLIVFYYKGVPVGNEVLDPLIKDFFTTLNYASVDNKLKVRDRSSCLAYATQGSSSFSSITQQSKLLSITILLRVLQHQECEIIFRIEWTSSPISFGDNRISRNITPWKYLSSPRWCLGDAFLALCSMHTDSSQSLGFQPQFQTILHGHSRLCWQCVNWRNG